MQKYLLALLVFGISSNAFAMNDSSVQSQQKVDTEVHHSYVKDAHSKELSELHNKNTLLTAALAVSAVVIAGLSYKLHKSPGKVLQQAAAGIVPTVTVAPQAPSALPIRRIAVPATAPTFHYGPNQK